MTDLLSLGDCNPDLVLIGGDLVPAFGQREQLVDRAVLTIGGSAAIMACGAARLGLETALVAAVGSDPHGDYAVGAVADRGVDVSGVRRVEAPTGLTVILSRGDDRAILTSTGAMTALQAADVDPGILSGVRHLHVASYFLLDGLRPGLPALVAAAREAGVTVSLDPQDDPAGRWRSGLPELLPHLDLLFVNESESAALDTSACPLVVVKRGPQGAVAHTRGRSVIQAGVRVESVDATGAGDSFDAGFLAAWLGGADIPGALALACACGALSTRALGGTGAQPTRAEAEAALR
ncbi:MAG TPA: PfkB family carbohydrate kinase [Gaiellales bacterium]|nr:PfkB family carbohydrate kinase [Gaiellales bacterium]